MTFEYLKPFRTSGGQIVAMKALLTIHGNQYVEVHEDSRRFPAGELTPITQEQYQAYLENLEDMDEE